ncbi:MULTISPECIES: 2-hydroxyacid dehydrogenase [Marinobacter]|uniref:2-hydroxyacid dehydrogenase n=1 Tax=Marinobacter TaxID=2742 RepID=UPI001D0811C5|nr:MULTISPECIES: 2-hydroxyacid dehydrogenase [Marinobacter]MCG8517984.1 2-hydroxyacid dehydrogenase [Pseudomonadales bacterium]MCK7568514.1 2-hydroxyacid dehydrogenase [Marinobacter xestospongiae]UDL06517.1 2-hydroxyacid dehydrogenase [Marinobacter sp. CA1]
MKVAVFNTKPYEQEIFEQLNEDHQLTFLEPHLNATTASLAAGYPAVCAFVNDDLSGPVLEQLAAAGTRVVALRSAGFNNVDLAVAERLGIPVLRVPAYSPYAVAEHTVALMLSLNRNLHRAYARVREGNFALQGLMGFDFHGRTAGIVGTGKIGRVLARILTGFGMTVLATDPYPHDECLSLGVRYVELEELLARSDVVSLHCPLTPESRHLINEAAIAQMKPGVMLINTSRGALIDSRAVIAGLKSGRIGHLGLDVYEEEADLFFEDLSDQVIQDDVFSRLLTFPNVVITAHQAFFTRNALENIVSTTLANLDEFDRTGECGNRVIQSQVAG